MAKVNVFVKNLVPVEQLNGNDQDCFDIIVGEHFFDVPAGVEGLGAALDQFHISIPIKVLDDFHIGPFFVPSGDNLEILENMVCPQCGHDESFVISCRSVVRMYDHGTEESGADEYENDSGCRCPGCQHIGVVADFNHTDGERPTQETIINVGPNVAMQHNHYPVAKPNLEDVYFELTCPRCKSLHKLDIDQKLDPHCEGRNYEGVKCGYLFKESDFQLPVTSFTEPTNEIRAESAKLAMEQHTDGLECGVVDMLTNIMHYCELAGEDFLANLRMAEDHFNEELAESC